MSSFEVKAGSAWDRIGKDPALANARRKLSIHEIRLIIGHAQAASPQAAAIEAILRDPYGCRFCDSGKLRIPDNPDKGHDPDCGYLLAEVALSRATPF